MKKRKVFISSLATSLFILTAMPLAAFAGSYEYSYVGGAQVIGTVTRGTDSFYGYYGGARTTVNDYSVLSQATVTAQFGDGRKSNYSDYHYGSSYIPVYSSRGLPSTVNGSHYAKGYGEQTTFSSNL